MNSLLIASLVISAINPIESKLETRSGIIERYKDREDERRFAVKLTKEDGSELWLEEFSDVSEGPTRREGLTSFIAGAYEYVIAEKDGSMP